MPDTTPLPHLRFDGTPVALAYRGDGRGTRKIFRPNRAEHGAFLKRQFEAVDAEFESVAAAREDQGLGMDFGLVLNVVSQPGFPLKFISFEQEPTRNLKGIVVLNVRQQTTSRGTITKVALFVPFGRLTTLLRKVEAYADPSKDGKPDNQGHRHPKNEELLANVASVGVAALEALWTDPYPLPAENIPTWWEMWVRRADGPWEDRFLSECGRLGIEVPDQRLVLPDHVIFIARTDRSQLETSLDLLNTLAEIRMPRPCSVGITDLTSTEQHEWIAEALDRIEWPGEDAPAVCIVDTGVNRGHPLIEPLLAAADSQTILPDGDASDSQQHGTPMAGLCAFGDLRSLMLSTGAWRQLHRLESVKLIATGREHDPENYGAVTQQAIFLPEIAAKDRKRVYCLALTRSTPADDGRPSSWSAAIDASISGSQEEGTPRRVVMISAGNWRVFDEQFDYPRTLHSQRVQDPAQAWNAITVGAFTDRVTIEEEDDESRRSRPLAPAGGLSPFSVTSLRWQKRWPIKPEVLMEGGNLARTQDGDITFPHSLQLLSTSASYRVLPPVGSMNATSAATALASRLAGRLLHAYPAVWPETLRGLVVHSARWTEQMLGFGVIDPFRAGSSVPVESLLRTFGYGAVNEDRALASLSNQATILIENSLQPYREPAGKARLHQAHLHLLPWPKELLETNPDHPVTMSVTLSYFVEPNPGSRTWERNSKYHYPGCLLRFKVKHKDMAEEDFRAGLEASQDTHDDGQTDEAEEFRNRSLHDPGWALGGRLRGKCGSVVQDLWQGTTGQLAEMGHISVYPVKGWWATRKFPEGHEHHNCHLRHIRYSLIVSIETEADLPIYSEVEAAIATIEVPSANIEIAT
jgi:hypothetical protein